MQSSFNVIVQLPNKNIDLMMESLQSNLDINIEKKEKQKQKL